MITGLTDRFVRGIDDQMSFNSFCDTFYDALQAHRIDGFYYWTYDRGALNQMLDDDVDDTSLVLLGRGPNRLKPLEFLYWSKKWYRNDPTLAATEERSAPFRTRDVIPRNGQRHAISAYLDLVAHYGITQDLFVPCHTPQRIQALYYFSLGDPAFSALSSESAALELTRATYAFGNGIADFARKKKPEEAARSPRLTLRETECLSLTAAGMSSQEISTVIGVRPRTVKFHIDNVLAKLGARTRAQAVGDAIKSKMLTD